MADFFSLQSNTMVSDRLGAKGYDLSMNLDQSKGNKFQQDPDPHPQSCIRVYRNQKKSDPHPDPHKYICIRNTAQVHAPAHHGGAGEERRHRGGRQHARPTGDRERAGQPHRIQHRTEQVNIVTIIDTNICSCSAFASVSSPSLSGPIPNRMSTVPIIFRMETEFTSIRSIKVPVMVFSY